MEFWGEEVKHGEPLKVSPGEGMVLHLSQASLGELKKDKGNESIHLFVSVDGKKLVLGTLFTEKLPQLQFDLVFDRDFEISHNWKNGIVYLYGYKASNPYEDEEIPEGDSEDSDEDVPIPIANNGKPEPKSKEDKPADAVKANAATKKESDGGKQKVTISEPKKEENSDEDDESSGDETFEDSESEDSDDSDDSDDSEDSDEDETPKKVESSKKRPAESSVKTPVADKKAKAAHPKSDGKKGEAHVDTPHPAAKLAGKTPASSKPQQTPKSAGTHSCKSCNRTFGSDQALDSHTKAKHGK